MFSRQFPIPARAMARAARENLRREHAIDLEQLEFHGIAAGVRSGIHKSQGPGQIASVIAGGLGDEKRALVHDLRPFLNRF
jgi:hypothetical protein